MKNNNFKVVLTTRNAADYIEKSISSLKNQRYSNFVCCVIDDCSTDNSVEIIKKVVGEDKRFTLIFNNIQKHGLCNRVYGTNLICKNDEDIVVILDGDDWFIDNTVLEYLNHVYQDENIWITYGQHEFATGDLGVSRYYDAPFIRGRNTFWNLSHLRSYKYWLFKRIQEQDFKDKKGDYFLASEDVVALYPMAEMAGRHLKFLPVTTYIYNNLSPHNEYKIAPIEQFNTYHELLKRPPYPLIEKNKEFKKLSLKLYDEEFKHCNYSGTDINGSEYIEWYRGEESRDFIFYTNRCLDKVDLPERGVRIAWLLEPENILPQSYQYIRENYNKFDYILTHNKSILDSIPNSFYIPAAQTWIPRNEWGLHNKKDLSCFIYSKTPGIEGHSIREKILKEFSSKITKVVGRGISPFQNKIDILRKTYYCIVAQNSIQKYYFTEHLIDCFLTGTVPIFYGDPSIIADNTSFDSRGVHFFHTLEELEKILLIIGAEDYANKYPAIKDNFITAHQYYLQEDYIYNYFLRDILIGVYPGC